MMATLTKEEREVWHKYHIQSTGNMNRCKVNAIMLNMHNDYLHEQAKFVSCYDIRSKKQSFITEAERAKQKGKPTKIVDVVNLSTGEEIECVYKHENDE